MASLNGLAKFIDQKNCDYKPNHRRMRNELSNALVQARILDSMGTRRVERL